MVINKKMFLDAVSCTTFSWKNAKCTNNDSEPFDYEKELKIVEGNEIGERARKIFPNGVLIEEKNIDIAVYQTKQAITKNSIKVLFEAAFFVDGLITRPDILVRQDDYSFEMIEVKSSINDKPELIDDMAYTGMVLKLGGLNVNKYSLMLISKDYRLGMNDEQMFKKIDHTEEVKNKIIEMVELKSTIKAALVSDIQPESTLTITCRNCDYLEECFPKYATVDSIFNLPRLSEKQFIELTKVGIISIKNIPDIYRLSDTQSFARDSIRADKLIKMDKLSSMLKLIKWPIYYLDFESMMTAIPLFERTAPYTQIPTQFSIHLCEILGTPVAHYEYIADKNGDCREKLADALISYLGESGTVFSYSSFEKTIIKGLIELFPAKEIKLNSIIDRIFDLENIVKCTYHPNYFGSYSIKKTLPALVPSLNYDDLDINNGGMAMSVFALMIKGMIEERKEKEIRQALLNYCERDTYAMVKLHEELSKI